MNFISTILHELPANSAGSEKTARTVLDMCGSVGGKAVFVGDDVFTPTIMSAKLSVTAAYSDECRAEMATGKDFAVCKVHTFELPDTTGCNLLWYNGVVEYDGVSQRLAMLRGAAEKSATIVYRTLCWLIDPSPDTKVFCERRFGIIEPLDRVITLARECGFKVEDFYISPRSDWMDGYYRPLLSVAESYHGITHTENEISAGLSELRHEMDMFELHSEEYSYVYYIMKG